MTLTAHVGASANAKPTALRSRTWWMERISLPLAWSR